MSIVVAPGDGSPSPRSELVLAWLKHKKASFRSCSLDDAGAQTFTEDDKLLVVDYIDPKAATFLAEVRARFPELPMLLLAQPNTDAEALVGPGSVLTETSESELESAFQYWHPAAAVTARLDSAALSKLYLAGGRALADQIIAHFLREAPVLLRQSRDEGNSQALHLLSERAGRVGARDLQEQAVRLKDSTGSPSATAWQNLERTLNASIRVLEKQLEQDRTV